MLREMGYHVGKSGLDEASRRRILLDAVAVHLVADTPDALAYIREWGAPHSATRVDKIKRCLRGFAASASRKDADMSAAIADWLGDLDWLRSSVGQ